MILATGMRSIIWSMVATVTRLVEAEAAGNLSDQAVFWLYFLYICLPMFNFIILVMI